jgi:hypothetical protein
MHLGANFGTIVDGTKPLKLFLFNQRYQKLVSSNWFSSVYAGIVQI